MQQSLRSFPRWTTDYIAAWKQRLMLCEWEIIPVLSAAPNDDATGKTRAAVWMSYQTREAVITFLNTIPDDLAEVSTDDALAWRKTIIHELLHIRLRALDLILEYDTGQHLSKIAYETVSSFWDRTYEIEIDLLAGVLVRLEAGD